MTESAGARLKKVRLEKGVSLEDAHKKTKIHLNILKAMEGDGLTELSPIYLKGFLKIYCNFLGVDPKDYVPDYKGGAIARPTITAPATKDKPQNAPSFIKSTGEKLAFLRPKIKFTKAAVYILVAAFFTLSLFNLGKALFSKRSRPLKIQTAKSLKPKKPAVSLKENPAQNNPVKSKDAFGSGIRLGIRTARNKCWLSIKADGKTVFYQTLAKGRFESWQAKEKFELVVADASAVELEVNGKFFSNLGSRKQKLNISIDSEKGLVIKR